MRSWNAAGVVAGALVGFAPAPLVLAFHQAASLRAALRTPNATQVAQTIHDQSGREAYCRAWAGHPRQFWCSDYGGTRCFYALFAAGGAGVSEATATEARIPCLSGQAGLHATPSR